MEKGNSNAVVIKNGAEGGEMVPEAFSGDNVRASWPFSLHTIRTNMAHCSPDRREMMISAFLWCTDPKHPIRREEFADRVGYGANTIYKIYTGKYIHPASSRQMDVPVDMAENVRKFLDIERERFLGGANEFVVTPTARKVWMACDLARESRTPVFISSYSHIGKTWALEKYTQENNHGRTVYCRMKAASGLGGMVRRLATSVGVSPKSNTEELTDRIKHALTKDMLLICDEVHLLSYTYRKESFFACMEVLREIYDEVECGVVLSGTNLLLERMDEGRHREMEQLLRRGVHRFKLPPMPTKSDITAILKHWGLEFPDRGMEVQVQKVRERPYETLRALAKKNGLKAITERLRYGRKIAARRKETFTLEHFVEANLTIATEDEGEEEWN